MCMCVCVAYIGDTKIDAIIAEHWPEGILVCQDIFQFPYQHMPLKLVLLASRATVL